MTLTLHVPLPYNLDDPLEQGGLLFGLPGHVHACTGPLPADERGTHSLVMLDPGHNAAAALAAAQGWHYLGYWHSHPAGTPPVPSEVDIGDWYRAADQLFPHSDLPFLDFPIITGGVYKCWRLDRARDLKEVTLELRPR